MKRELHEYERVVSMEGTHYLDRLIGEGTFRFDRLVISSIDNEPIIELYGEDYRRVETNLFHQEVKKGDEYMEMLHRFVLYGLCNKSPAPVVRFADGEYAFYDHNLHCNGLYQQAESIGQINAAIPMHLHALETLQQIGKITPVIYPGNVQRKGKRLFSFLRKSKGDDLAIRFLDFLYDNKIELNGENYIPFFVVYAFLTSKRFSKMVDGRNLNVINSECRMTSVNHWFERFFSHPKITFTEIPDSYVATRWGEIKKDVLSRIPQDTDLCLVGAGAGSLLVCVDVARQFGIPAIDAGHVLNMMNGLEEKSNGPRLYTIHKNE